MKDTHANVSCLTEAIPYIGGSRIFGDWFLIKGIADEDQKKKVNTSEWFSVVH